MSYKNSLLKLVLNNTPKGITLWAINKKIKGLAELTDFEFNSDERKLYAEVLLAGEQETVEVWIDGITLITEETLTGEEETVEAWIDDNSLRAEERSYKLVVQQVKSSRPWLDALLIRVVLNREWKIPESQSELVYELFAADNEQEQADNNHKEQS